MLTLFLIAIILLIILYFHFTCKHTLPTSEKFIPRNDYAAPGSLEWQARQYQQNYLPSSDTLAEDGGAFMQDARIQPALT